MDEIFMAIEKSCKEVALEWSTKEKMRGFDHFLHEHPLNFCDTHSLLKEFLNCSGCGEGLSGLICACSTCYNFFLHKSCAELPREIQNFFHPCPLLLNILNSYTCNACFKEGSGFTYRCVKCDFDMHVKCAQRPTIQSQGDEEELIQHFTHWHPLKLVPPNNHLEVGCAICNKLCFVNASDTSAYGCQDCNFFVHHSCMIDIPRQINHFFHRSCPLVLLTKKPYQCEGCDEASSGLAFCCGKCKFQLDVKCALLPTVESKDAEKIQHPAHKHPLALHESKEFGTAVRCRACGEHCLLDPCFGCSKISCTFFLHRKCVVELQPEIHHPFHSLHPLTLLRDLSYQCKVCYEDVLGLAYCCVQCKFQLDVKCTLFPTIESKDADKILHCAHKHPLALCDSKELGDEVRCRACAKSCFAPFFGCTECNFFLHRSCAVEVQEKEIHHPFHPLHALTLSSPLPLPHHKTFQCSSCLGLDDWFLLRYRCAKCDFELHIDCSKPKVTIPDFKYERHIHYLSYFDNTLAPVECNICHEHAQTGFFRCVACAFNIHIYCIRSTPKTIKHQRHLHPLTVTKSPFQYEMISSEHANCSNDEFYCDVCEKRRYKFESVYYCPECKFIAEVRCVISELLPSLTISEEQTTEKGTVGSGNEGSSAVEETIGNLNDQIAKSKQERKALKKEVEKHREILKGLEEELEQKNWEVRKLKTDCFLYKYRLSLDMKGHENPTKASADLP
ncbi:uncharacterized protein LOC108468421 [Gossypium arboreum]|uniref:DC1 domain-containing protein n=1 Tax=Gossypium arboreum TaxID=29729 RepID=A0ABR0P424_GOSAR|nr:uncharacterized protein LOC108468421 [Gossypium arboreum]KAK5813100.1 hypothetical protein PVK06_028546 [Gossypium arboreum]